MKLEYEGGTLRVENPQGLRWQLARAEKPPFTFPYDALSVTPERALRRVGSSVYPLALDEIAQVTEWVSRLEPPAGVTLQTQMIGDLRAVARGLVATLVAELEYDGLTDVLIAARPDSTDLYAEEARRVLAYVDSVSNAFQGLAAQVAATPAEELLTLKDYASQLPFPPEKSHFTGGGMLEELFGATLHFD